MRRVLAAFAIAVASASEAQAIVGGLEPAANDHRFDAVCQIITRGTEAGYNGLNGTGTLISPTEVVFAKHSWICPNGLHTARFRINPDGFIPDPDTDPPNLYFHVEIVSIDASLPGDVVVGTLASPVEHIQPLLLGFGISPPLGDPVFIASWGDNPRPVPPIVGRLYFMQSVVNLVTECRISYSNPGPPGPACDNCQWGFTHDSGSPVLWNNGAELVLVNLPGGRPDYVFADPVFGCNIILAPGEPNIPPVNAAGCVTDFDGDGYTGIGDRDLVDFHLGCQGCGCLGDADGDCDTDSTDLTMVNMWFGPCGCDGDANGDAKVDLADLNAIFALFGQCIICDCGQGPCAINPCPTRAADLNRDGHVNLFDLNIVLSNFGCDHGQ